MRTEAEQRERIPTVIHESAALAARALAAEIAALIRERARQGRTAVLGLATGSTPVPVYRELIRLHREEGLSFAHVITFNLDEYYGLPRAHPESYWEFMQAQLFRHIDIPPANIHLPDGTVPRSEVYASCQRYEDAIRAAGGVDLQILGIGRTGHVGFNEPGSARDSRTRLVTLDRLTRRDAARDFLGEANVPRHAITMGVGTILDARRIVLLAWGEAKAAVVARAVEGTPDEALPASLLQGHLGLRFDLDRDAAGDLTRLRRPWLVGPVDWNADRRVRRAVCWLASHARHPVLKLLDEHYSEHGLGELLTEKGPAYDLNIGVFNELQHTITGWPGGKPGADDTHRPERAEPHPKRVLVLSPEPGDAVVAMGGTLHRLVEQGHEVTVVAMTSGNLAVPDEEAAMTAALVQEATQSAGGSELARAVASRIAGKGAFEADAPETRRFKGLIRRAEFRAALRACGVTDERIHCADLPFYERGRYRQFRPGQEDVEALAQIIGRVRPHQVFATGRAQDPASVAAVCWSIAREALSRAGDTARVWLYRSPEKPWEPSEIDMAVPMSPDQLARKAQAIFQLRSQRSQSPASAHAASPEPWEQAGERNRETARTYDALGLADYEALECFERHS